MNRLPWKRRRRMSSNDFGQNISLSECTQWREANRITTMHPGNWNRWFLQIRATPETTRERARDLAQRFLWAWIGYNDKGACDHVRIKVLGTGAYPPEGMDHVEQLISSIPNPPTIEGWRDRGDDAWIGVMVEFVYRGSARSLPWPVWQWSSPIAVLSSPLLELLNTWDRRDCPRSTSTVDAMLAAAMTPPRRKVPEPDGWWQRLPDLVKLPIRTAATVWSASIVAGLAALYVWAKVKP